MDARRVWIRRAAERLRLRGNAASAAEVEGDAALVAAPWPEARIRLASRLRSAGDLGEAANELRLALASAVESTAARKLLAEVLLDAGSAREALDVLERLAADYPGDVQVLSNLGLAYTITGQARSAVATLQRATELMPRSAAVWSNFGSALQRDGRSREALAAFARAAAIEPRRGVLQGNVARTLLTQRRVDDALSAFVRQIALDPGNPVAFSELLMAMNYSETISAREAVSAHRLFADRFEAPLAADRAHAKVEAASGRRLRVGFVSADLCRHSVTHFLEPLLDHLDAEMFETFAYRNGGRSDEVTERLKTRFTRWCEVGGLGDARVAQIVAADRIDILVDVSGHTEGNRLGVFARRPAPVQVTWLGYPNTTGLRSIDFRITDPFADPEGANEAWHTERLWRLPRCFVCYRAPVDAPPVDRQPQTDGLIHFASFNSHIKIGRRAIGVWANILRELPNSHLVLKLQGPPDSGLSEGLLADFEKQGIERQRVKILGWLDRSEQHLERYRSIDVALDTFPYAGTTTTCDALWMGVPVVTLAGEVHASRVGVSLLQAVGLPELVACDVDDYVRKAVQLASDRRRLAELRTGLRARVAASSLTDGATFARDFGAALQGMWQDWCSRQGAADATAGPGPTTPAA